MRYAGIRGEAWESVREGNKRREKDCYTCGKKDLVGSDAQSGHYRPVAIVGAYNVWSWDTRTVHLQCADCNGPKKGAREQYRAHLIRDYGRDFVEALDKEIDQRRSNPVQSWAKVIEDWKNA